jgi:tRNA (mo5U34)-methyltransferase
VERVEMSVYDLAPSDLGTFDVVVCGALMLHLRDPVRALEAIRSVCAGRFLSIEQIRLALTARHPRRPVAQLDGYSSRVQWWVPNVAGHRRMLQSAGFDIESATRPFAVPFGSAHPERQPIDGRAWLSSEGRRSLVRRTFEQLALGREGAPYCAALARPAGARASRN